MTHTISMIAEFCVFVSLVYLLVRALGFMTRKGKLFEITTGNQGRRESSSFNHDDCYKFSSNLTTLEDGISSATDE